MTMQLISQDIRNWWKLWELRLIILFSALLQIILVLMGSRRKSTYNHKLKALVWSTYLTADSVATLALGVLSNRLANIKEVAGKLEHNDQLIAFWAPFLLLHLGGPDTITAYALEDNELWLRHLARVIVQTGLACYIYFMALTGSPLSVLAAPMIGVGFIKYGERTLSLYFASKEQLRDSMLSPPESGPIYPKITEKYNLRRAEGFDVTVDKVIEVQAPEDLSIEAVVEVQAPENLSIEAVNVHDEKSVDLLKASSLFEIFKLLFINLILSLNDLGSSKFMFKSLASESAFRIVEIELSFMYDLLYTKGILLYTRWGVIGRSITLSITCGVLVFFSVAGWEKYTKVDISITFALLGTAIILEIYSAFAMISSDWWTIWVLKNQTRYEAKVIKSLQFCEQPRWSMAVAQFSLLHFSLRETPWYLKATPKAANFYEKLQKYYYISHNLFKNSMKDWICKHLRNKAEQLKLSSAGGPDVKTVSSDYEAGGILKRESLQHDMTWSTDDIEFDQSILVWHVATELCHFGDRNSMSQMHGEAMTNYTMSQVVSKYMLYLLVMHPFMLPTGIGQLRYADTSLEARKYFEDQRCLLKTHESENRDVWAVLSDLFKRKTNKDEKCSSCGLDHKSVKSKDLCEACHWLLSEKTDLSPGITRGGKSKSVLFDACKLAAQLNQIGDLVRKWEIIGKIWGEALMHAACRCEGYQHAQRLAKGGELLSHVWLLMAHFGISEQVRVSEGHAIAKLIKK